MQHSGVGNPESLAKLGIKPVINLPGVGENLQDHVEVAIMHECLKPVSLLSAQKPHNMVRHGLEWFLRRKGMDTY